MESAGGSLCLLISDDRAHTLRTLALAVSTEFRNIEHEMHEKIYFIVIIKSKDKNSCVSLVGVFN